MKTVGIVAEYNPFHNGHKYHIEEARRISGADRVIVIMSGSFVQRGEPACADKFTRAAWAIDNGADAVIELPDLFSVSCAERFASGAIRILHGTGIVDSLCFGSESGDVCELEKIAAKTPDRAIFAEAIGSGLSYPRALSEAGAAGLSPNDILGAEYIRAAKKCFPELELYAVKRRGGGYGDVALGGEFSSARSIRNALSLCRADAKMSPAVFDGLTLALPRNVLDGISEAVTDGAFIVDPDALSEAILYRFRSMSESEIRSLPEVAEGLENLFFKHSRDSQSVSEMLSSVKSKRYTMARLKRICIYALLGIGSELQDEAAVNDEALYARVIAVRKQSADLIEKMRGNSKIPVIVRSADREQLPPLARKVEKISSLAHRIRVLGQSYEKSALEDSSFRLIVRE